MARNILAVWLLAQLVTPLVKALTPHKKELSRRDFASITSLVPLIIPSVASPLDGSQGISAVTESSLGKSFRRSVIKGAQVADSLDERWERFSDGLRDKSQCDEQTGRRLYDNGKRKDGTSIGNPGLGSLCNPEPLMPLKPEVATQIFNLAIASASFASGKGEDVLRDSIKQVKSLVAPSFERKEQQSETVDEKEKVRFNFEVYSTLRGIATFLNDDKKSIRRFQTKWGQELVSMYAPSATSKDYISPFSEKKDEFRDYDYDKSKLLDSLGKLTVVLTQMKAAGIVGSFEISIPYDDYGSVVTVAVDDYVPIGSEILLSEQAYKVEGPTQALLRYLIGAAGIDCSLDTFYIDPSTTRQVDYNPTQLLLSANGLRAI